MSILLYGWTVRYPEAISPSAHGLQRGLSPSTGTIHSEVADISVSYSADPLLPHPHLTSGLGG